jgi:hypothetical protein
LRIINSMLLLQEMTEDEWMTINSMLLLFQERTAGLRTCVEVEDD